VLEWGKIWTFQGLSVVGEMRALENGWAVEVGRETRVWQVGPDAGSCARG
jgi:hypothetical protein